MFPFLAPLSPNVSSLLKLATKPPSWRAPFSQGNISDCYVSGLCATRLVKLAETRSTRILKPQLLARNCTKIDSTGAAEYTFNIPLTAAERCQASEWLNHFSDLATCENRPIGRQRKGSSSDNKARLTGLSNESTSLSFWNRRLSIRRETRARAFRVSKVAGAKDLILRSDTTRRCLGPSGSQ